MGSQPICIQETLFSVTYSPAVVLGLVTNETPCTQKRHCNVWRPTARPRGLAPNRNHDRHRRAHGAVVGESSFRWLARCHAGRAVCRELMAADPSGTSGTSGRPGARSSCTSAIVEAGRPFSTGPMASRLKPVYTAGACWVMS